MAMASINVNKKCVKDFLREGKQHPFLIPEYQRPYAWTDEQVVTLFEDLLEFTENSVENEDDMSSYFLGSIVSYENEAREQEIIDGQQRITSLFLLLRAIYTKLDSMPSKPQEAKHFCLKLNQLFGNKTILQVRLFFLRFC